MNSLQEAPALHLARQLHNAREDERCHLARELHDELGALLTTARLDAARIRNRLQQAAATLPALPELLARLAHLVAALDEVAALKRRITEDLHPSVLKHFGLAAGLGSLLRDFHAQTGVAVQSSLQPVVLSPAAELALYRVVQEALNNTTRHARARHVLLELAQCHGQVQLSYRDDGVGFDTQQPARTAGGLQGMRCRVLALGGQWHLHSTPGQGTAIDAHLPLAVLPMAVP